MTVNVTDTYTQVPNLKGQFHDDVLRSKYGLHTATGGCSTNSMEDSRIWTTKPGPGSIVAYGSSITVWYVNNNNPQRACAGL